RTPRSTPRSPSAPCTLRRPCASTSRGRSSTGGATPPRSPTGVVDEARASEARGTEHDEAGRRGARTGLAELRGPSNLDVLGGEACLLERAHGLALDAREILLAGLERRL